ncbi:UNVERIFIED_CONTAM: ATP-binding cassette sub- A member 2, partial [Siphonaria sp. JEL0065]
MPQPTTSHFMAVLKLRLLLSRREFMRIFSGAVFPLIMVGFAMAIAAGIPPPKFPKESQRTALFDMTGLAARPPSTATLKLGVVSSPSSSSSSLSSSLISGALNSALQRVVSHDLGPNRLTTTLFGSNAAFAAADVAALIDSTANPFYKGGFSFNESAFATDSLSNLQDFSYTVLLEGTQNSGGFPLLASYMASLANIATGESLSSPSITPKVATFVTGKLVDIGAHVVPPFLVNALTFSVLNVAEARVKENENGVVSQLYLSGINARSFFIATAVADGLVYLWAVASSVFFLCVIGFPAGLPFVAQPSLAGYIFPMLIYGTVVLPYGYCLSFCFKKPTSVGTVGASLLSLIVFVPYFVVEFIVKAVSREATLGFSALVPSFGLYQILNAHALSVESGSPYTISDVFDINKLSLPIMLIFLAQSAFYSALAIFLFHLQRNNITFFEFIGRKQVSTMKAKAVADSHDLESDLADDASFPLDLELQAEKELLQKNASDGTFDDARVQMVVEGVDKVVNSTANGSQRKNLVILNDLWFSVRKGECFGFLGPNGAGKSTTMKILTGLETLTSGRVRFSSDPADKLTATHIPNFVNSQIGYCPQHDALWAKLTCREHLKFYATIRGISDADAAAAEAIQKVGIEKADVHSDKLSGGNRRRLMLAIATIGKPKLIFLDEPTTGVDIAIRRNIWSAIEEYKKDSAVILTSHSMEEVDALSDRIGILVNGKLRCLGSSQHLKSTFGSGYIITLRTINPTQTAAVQSWFIDQLTQQHYPTKCTRVIGCTLVFEVTSSDQSVKHSVGLLETVFGILQKKEEMGIHDFSVAQTTLQQ